MSLKAAVIVVMLACVAKLCISAMAPARDPLPQLVLPCRVVSVHDGDTVTAEVTVRFNVRLLDCWAPEITGPQKAAGERARLKLDQFAAGKTGVLTVPFGADLGKSLSLNRVLGRISVDGQDLSEQMVASELASRKKP